MPVELQILFSAIGTITGVFFFIYATVQFRAFLKSRQQETALTLMRTTSPPELFSRSVRRIFELPDDAPPRRSTRSVRSSRPRSSRPA